MRTESVCNKAKFAVPAAGDGIECEVCNPGSYIGVDKDKSCCSKCPNGMFSTGTNANICQVCPAGMKAAKAIHYANLEKMPETMDTRCERSGTDSADICSIHRGWIVANGGFTALPYLPQGARLILRTRINVTKSRGRMDLAYNAIESSNPAESFKIRIDGQTTGTYYTNSLIFSHVDLPIKTLNGTMSFFFFSGIHVVEWIYEKLRYEVLESPLLLSYVRIEGTADGSADSCVKCPKNTFSTAGSVDCTECPAGQEANENSTIYSANS